MVSYSILSYHFYYPRFLISVLLLLSLNSCSKKETPAPVTPASLTNTGILVNGVTNGTSYTNLDTKPLLKLSFSSPLKASSVTSGISLTDLSGNNINYNASYENNNSTVLIQPAVTLKGFTKYTLILTNKLESTTGGKLSNQVTIDLRTGLDSADKFPIISDSALLDLVQKQTFKYFWDFGHPVSGLARERNTSGNLVTSGGSGFGIMAIITGIHRNFITRPEGLARLQKIVGFLKNSAKSFHGAYPHWLDGSNGNVIPFSTRDNGADLVETAYLMQGLLTARQYFNLSEPAEISLRTDINQLWNAVDWNWFRKNNENVLYWHWSNDYQWQMDMQVRGWNEALIVYILAASSNTNPSPKLVYDNGWAQNGAMRNGNTYYGIKLPLGPAYGGPLFFAHYSFLGINPNQLNDSHANYFEQNKNHTLINYNYCKANPRGFAGYSDLCWGLTASDDNKSGYQAHDPNNDNGVISPTAALSSFPYTPTESMNALRFFYYKLGDKIWKEYGFVDAFNLTDVWFAESFLAIDQGPIIIMIENHRSGLLWSLFMSCPEIKTGMRNLGFQSPEL